jgi:hypothetical protein
MTGEASNMTAQRELRPGKDDTMTHVEKLRRISPQEFALMGMQDIAYVKRKTADDGVVFAIHAADGTEVAVLSSRDAAVATIRQHELEPLSLH